MESKESLVDKHAKQDPCRRWIQAFSSFPTLPVLITCHAQERPISKLNALPLSPLHIPHNITYKQWRIFCSIHITTNLLANKSSSQSLPLTKTMMFLNPVYGIIVPFLFIFTIPFAIFACLTTIFAFSILFFRVLIVYIELALAVIPYWILGERTSSPPSPRLPRTKSFSNSSNSRRRKRRGSTSSNLSATGSITPISGENGMGLSQSIGPTRDYEGVGGWRVDNPSDDDGLWTKINSRLELPADHVRRHHRSLTSGSLPGSSRSYRSYSPEALMNTSRARTPPTLAIGMEGYFPQVPITPKMASKRTPSVNTGFSGSSTSSKGSSVLSMKQR